MTISPQEELIQRAQLVAERLAWPWDSRLETILRFCVANPAAFPARARKKIQGVAEIDESYLKAYIGRYHRERDHVLVLQPVATKPDPAVDEVLKAFEKISPEGLGDISEAHRLSMQAENIVGKLLERYVAGLLESKGWIWCCGETMRSVDFIKDAGSEEVKLLQIKNRDNSENSSSSAIREGTKIKKWYRINSRTGRTRWDELPENSQGHYTEEGFYRFVVEEANRTRGVEEIPQEQSEYQELFP